MFPFRGLKSILVLLVLFFSLISTDLLLAQEQNSTEESIFGGVRDELTKARNQQVDILSPKNFGKATDEYSLAYEKFKKGGELKDITNRLEKVRTYLADAYKTAEVARVPFASALEARDKALKANAPEFAPDLYAVARKSFEDAALRIEAGDLNGAREKAKIAENDFNQAELKAIKGSILGEARRLVEEARTKARADKYAPVTLKNSEDLLASTEQLLNTERYAAEDATSKAEQAAYQARHAIYLSNKFQSLKTDYPAFEKLVLDEENLISRIGKEVDYNPEFDQGPEKPVESIILAIDNLKQEKKELLSELQQKDEKIKGLDEKIDALEEKAAQKEAGYKELELKSMEEQDFVNLEKSFTQDEASVIKEGENIIIRLYGINFPSGKSTILPESFGLLSKVQKAIRDFPDRKIIIEGHTDSMGDETYNMQLSLDRAKAVTSYLIANMGIAEDRITTAGYGESRPIASNDTKEGRQQNRRIDVVLVK
ncbi:MAG TPA: OmpA family protein [Terriglobales bacterium]|nr:OmpA family protein [Terriglobales bacterium]